VELLAYIDPGAGSLFLQAVIATILVVPFFLRTQVRRGIDRLRGVGPTSVNPAVSAVAGEDPTPTAQP
jgi:hypothetical protein